MIEGLKRVVARPTPYDVVVGGFVIVCLVIGALTPIVPAMAVALVVVGALAAAAVSQPLITVALLLAIGGLPLEQLTGGEKSLLQGFGGASASGIVLVAMVALLTLVLINSKVFSRISFFEAAFMVLLLVGGVSILWAPSALAGFRVLSKIAYPFLIYLGIRAFMVGEREREVVMRLMLAGGIVVSAWAMYGFFTVGLRTFLSGGVYPLTISTTHPTPFGFYMASLYALCYARWRHSADARGYAVLAALFAAEGVMSQSRMAMFGVVLVTVLVELSLSRSRTRWLKAAGVGLVLVAIGGGVILSVPQLQEGVFYTPQSLRSTPAEIVEALNDQGRGNVAVAMVTHLVNDESLFYGEGMGSSWVALQLGELGDLGGAGVAHNEYVRLLYETGVLGLAVAIVALVAFVYTAWRASQRMSERYRWLGSAAFALSVCYIVFSLTDNVLDYYNTFSQYPFFALAAALAMDAAAKRASSSDPGAAVVTGEPIAHIGEVPR